MTKEQERSKVQTAIVDLRESFQLSQQGLATHMGKSINAIARWETTRIPSGLSLIELEKVARQFGRHDIAEIFSEEFTRQMGLLGESVSELQLIKTMLERLYYARDMSSHAETRYWQVVTLLAEAHGELVSEIRSGELDGWNLENLVATQRQVEKQQRQSEKRHGKNKGK